MLIPVSANSSRDYVPFSLVYVKLQEIKSNASLIKQVRGLENFPTKKRKLVPLFNIRYYHQHSVFEFNYVHFALSFIWAEEHKETIRFCF